MERKKDKGGERVQILRICGIEKWRTRETREGKGGKNYGGDRAVWGIGKRRFGKDWRRKLRLFDALVWTIAGYGVEIWGWKERQKMEGLQQRFLRWVLGVEGRTPGYMIRKELQR